MREEGVRKAFSVRDKRTRVKAIKAYVSKRFTENYAASSYGRLAELKAMTTKNKYFLTQDPAMKKYRRQAVSRISRNYQTFYFRDAYYAFETIILIMFNGELKCLDSMTDEDIVKAESYIKSKTDATSTMIDGAEKQDDDPCF
ncbi:hypothetical protein GR140_18905 [Pseudomonas putida]|uniref:hypothetical protein n=1 Tax=Pseudomonas putida TaxID=303 RepID=UPI001BAE99B2|nr:hypothetical protein [Pseudomonas putida]QUG90735.1 hypothetical protein GR140_18905 [Pseudomonas putida]